MTTMAQKVDSQCCYFGEKLGISALQNDLNDVKWPSLTKRQQEEKLHHPELALKGVSQPNCFVY